MFNVETTRAATAVSNSSHRKQGHLNIPQVRHGQLTGKPYKEAVLLAAGAESPGRISSVGQLRLTGRQWMAGCGPAPSQATLVSAAGRPDQWPRPPAARLNRYVNGGRCALPRAGGDPLTAERPPPRSPLHHPHQIPAPQPSGFTNGQYWGQQRQPDELPQANGPVCKTCPSGISQVGFVN